MVFLIGVNPGDGAMLAQKKAKKSPRSCDLGLNPPKEEGGGDNRGTSGSELLSITTLLGFSPRQLRFDIRCTNYRAIFCAAQDFFNGVAKIQKRTKFAPPALRTMYGR
ncbi:hypothetical protein RBI22_20205 [Alcaligenaceae bacterium C4P045]|nr:hypothetical protein [Alcaligenaceae bacterium C4P045]